MKKLFQYAILYHKRVRKEPTLPEEIQTEELVAPSTILATDEKVAVLIIAKKIPDGYEDYLNHIEILLRPF